MPAQAGGGPEAAGLVAGPDRDQAGRVPEPAGLPAGQAGAQAGHGGVQDGDDRRRNDGDATRGRGREDAGEGKKERGLTLVAHGGRRRRGWAETVGRVLDVQRPTAGGETGAGADLGDPGPFPFAGRGRRTRPTFPFASICAGRTEATKASSATTAMEELVSGERETWNGEEQEGEWEQVASRASWARP